jgi:RyR domain
MTIKEIAKVCHNANKSLCEINDDFSQLDWDSAHQWQRDSAIKGVTFRLDNPDALPSAQHDAWMVDKVNDGWVFGEVKDPTAKTHPCLVPHSQLPEFQQVKDVLFQAIVDALV